MTHPAATPPTAEQVADRLFEDIRDRKLLKWFFPTAEEYSPEVYIGSPEIKPIEPDVQQEIRAAWIAIISAAIAPAERAEAVPERMFPILGGSPKSIPWPVIQPFDGQAKRNHSQDLERLAQRGGLGPEEALAVLTMVDYYKLPKMTRPEAVLRLTALVKERQALAAAPPAPAALDAAGMIEKTRDRLVEAVEAWGDGHDAGRVYNAHQSAVIKALNAYLDAKAALAAGDTLSARLDAYDNERPRNAKRALTADDK